MSEATTESPYSVTFRTDQTYSAAMVTVRADSAGQLAERLAALEGSAVEAIATAKALIAAVEAAQAVVNVQAPEAPVSTQAEPEVAVQQEGATVTNLRTCAHGKRVYKSGEKNGRKWSGWMCALPANAQGKCDPQWEN